jgi:transcriptional regulator GlxA family with amidase domain
MQFMADNLTQPLQLDDIAAAARLSPYHFHRVFSNTVSLTPQAYLTGLRIEKAKELLLTTELTISEIAAACGFSQPAYFSRVFREQAGLTPTSFREKHQTY